MLIATDEHLKRAGIKSLSKRCLYCRKPLSEYPLIMNDDAGFHVFHAACAAAFATDIIVDLYTFFRPPAPYHRLFVLDPICKRALQRSSQRLSCDHGQGL